MHQLEEAAHCFELALEHGGDEELNRYYLASVQRNPVPATAPRRHVEALFDTYAADFQSHLVKGLRYEGHERLLRPILDGTRRIAYALDLGCSTGLCGTLIHLHVDRMDGVDISQAMLEQADKLGIYRRLSHSDVNAFLSEVSEPADLIVAADVFIYIGDLNHLFQSVRRILAADGCFAFTVELSRGPQDLKLLPSLRYAHSEQYIRQ